MKTMRGRLAEGLDRAGERHRRGEAESPQTGGRSGWGQVLKSLALLQIARATRRVLERQDSHVEAGRLGGEVSAAPRAVPTAPPRPAVRTQEATQGSATEASTPRSAWEIAKTTFKEFSADNGTLMAASVAFYMFLSVIPLVLVGIAVLGFFLDDAQARARTLEFLRQFVADRGGREMIQEAVAGVNQAKGWAAWTGLLGLMLTATGGFATLETAINVIWGTPNRNFIMNKLFAFGMMLVIGALFLLSFGMTFAAAAVAEWAKLIPGLGAWAHNWGLRVVGLVLPVILSGAMFSVIYKFFPTVKMHWKPALIAGYLTAVLWEAAKIGYAFYTSHQNQSAAYGTLAGLVGFIMWVYYSSALVLLGSELTWVLAGRPRREIKHPAPQASNHG